jgi:cobalamin biosynthesis protein CbiG
VNAYVLGAGCSLGCPERELAELAAAVLAEAGVSAGQVRALATIDTRAREPAMRALAAQMGWALHTHPAAALAGIDVPTPSALVAAHVGTPSVAEAAALLSTGTGRLAVHKRRSPHATCALAEATA